MIPGETAFTRTPFFAHSIASDFVAAFKSPLVRDASTAGTLDIGWSTRLVVTVTASLLVHDLYRPLGHVKETRDIGGHMGSGVVFWIGGKRFGHEPTGVVDQSFHTIEAIQRFLEHQIRGLRVGYYISLHRRDIRIVGGRFDGSGRCNDLIVAASERLNKRCPDPLRCSQHGMKLTPSDTNIASVEDRKRKRVLQETSERGFMVIAVGADDEHQIDDHTNRRLRAVDLGLYRKFVGGGRLRVDCVARAPAQISRRFDRRLRVGQSVSDRLMLDDRMNAAASFGPGEVESDVERRAQQRHAENTDQRRGAGKAGSCKREAAAFIPEKMVPRRRNVLETELRREMRAVTHGLDGALEDDAGCGAFDRDD